MRIGYSHKRRDSTYYGYSVNHSLYENSFNIVLNFRPKAQTKMPLSLNTKTLLSIKRIKKSELQFNETGLIKYQKLKVISSENNFDEIQHIGNMIR